jgi:hypothetical protein
VEVIEMPTVKEIVVAVLKEMGADGLCEGECGCGLDNLMPCETVPIWCVPAKLAPVPAEHKDEYDEWYAPMTDEEIEAAIKESRHNIFVESLSHTQQIPESAIGTNCHHHCLDDAKTGGDDDEPQEPPEDET